MTAIVADTIQDKPNHNLAGSEGSTSNEVRLPDARSNKAFIESLSQSDLYREYEEAFTETTGMPLRLTPVETWQLPHRERPCENRFCSQMAEKSKSCSACLQSLGELTSHRDGKPHTLECPAGMCDTAAPIRMGDELVGFLHTGQVFLEKRTEEDFEKVRGRLEEWGMNADSPEIREAYFETSIVPKVKYNAVVTLLKQFAEHLSIVSNQILVQQAKQEPPMIARAKEYIREHYQEELSLGRVAKAVHASSFYFCKMFKKATGLNFTEYVSRIRIEKAKNLLLNPNLRVSEIAFEVGFQSLTHFNRVFKKVLGLSPTEYRDKLPNAA